MQVETIRVRLDEAEYAALVHLCERELRPLAAQARIVIREELRRQGLLPQEVSNAGTD